MFLRAPLGHIVNGLCFSPDNVFLIGCIRDGVGKVVVIEDDRSRIDFNYLGTLSFLTSLLVTSAKEMDQLYYRKPFLMRKWP